MSLITNLVSYWKLDESSGNATDSVSSNTLTNNNTVTYSAGKINNGANFVSASSKYLSIADNASLSITGNLSISAWVNFSSTPSSGNYYAIVSKLNGSPNYSYAFNLYNNAGTLSLYFQNSTNGTAVTQGLVAWTPTTSTWYHISAVYTAAAGSVSFYVNGVQQGSTQTGLGTSIFDSTSLFAIGFYDGGNYFDGSIDEVGIWSRALSADEVSQLYNSGIGNPYIFTETPNLYGAISYWKLDESSGNASDSIRSNTLTNNNTVTYSSGKINNGANFVKASSQSLSVVDASQTGLDMTGNFSISAWIKLTQLPSTAGTIFSIVSKYNQTTVPSGYQFFIDTANKLTAEFISGSAQLSQAVATTAFVGGDVGVWMHVSAIFTVATPVITLYKNGSSFTSSMTSSTATTIAGNSEPFYIGAAYNNAALKWFDGSIDEVGLWARLLSNTDILNLYNGGTGQSYPFNQITRSGFLGFFY